MNDEVLNRLNEMLLLWEKMKSSDVDEAAGDADRFQMMFYDFIHYLRLHASSIPNAPRDIEEARSHPDFEGLFAVIPEPLQIPFETELEDILAGHQREIDSTEQS